MKAHDLINANYDKRRAYFLKIVVPAWQTELRNGRHRQGHQRLRTCDDEGPCKRCCLDVLSELVCDLPHLRNVGWTYDKHGGYWMPDNIDDDTEFEIIPAEVATALGITVDELDVFTELNDGREEYVRGYDPMEHEAETVWIDRMSFEQIADTIPYVFDGSIKPRRQLL